MSSDHLLVKMRFQPHNLTFRLFRSVLREKLFILRHFSNNKSYNVLFFGSDSIALSSLRKINEFRKTENIINRLNLVTANQSKHPTIIEKYAKCENLETLTWPLKNVELADYDIGLIVAFGHMITKDILERFPLGMVNVHPSLLPRWRGAAPIVHTLLHGDKETGVSLMRIKPDQFDVGEIISQVRLPVPDNILQPELTETLSELGADMLVDCMRRLPDSLTEAWPQSAEGVTYARKINKSISLVRWAEMSSTQVFNLYRAIYDIYPLTTKFRDKQVKLFDAFLDNSPELDANNEVGTLQFCERRLAIKVLCSDRKHIYFKSLRILGKRKISALDFYNGYIKSMPSDKIKYVLC